MAVWYKYWHLLPLYRYVAADLSTTLLTSLRSLLTYLKSFELKKITVSNMEMLTVYVF